MFPLRSGALAPQQELCLVDNNVHREGEQYDNVSDLADASLEHWGLGSDVGSESTSQERTIRRRSSKACDQCRKYKCKCERSNPNEPCKNCVMLGTQCTFSGPSRKRGPPKGYIDAIEARLHQTEALLGIMLATSDPRAQSLLWQDIAKDPLAKEITTRVDGVKGWKRNGSGKDPINNANRHEDDDPENSYSGQSQDVNTPAEPCNMKAQMFPGASDLSIRHSEFNNVAGNFTKNTYINHVYPQPGSEPEQLSLKDHLSRAISELKSELKSEIFHAIETVKDVIDTFKDAIQTVKELLPCPFSTTADIPLEEKVADDAHKYPPLSQGTILLSKTSLVIPGVKNQLLSSIRYSFYS